MTDHDESERIRIALGYIPPDDRDVWVRMAMAVKDGLGEDGFSPWNEWSKQAKGYKEKDARDVWRSAKVGAVRLATLYHEAKKYGFDPRANRAKPVDAAELAKRQRERDAREQKEALNLVARERAAAKQASAIWDAALPAIDDHPYLVKKGIGAAGLRLYKGDLAISGMSCDGALIIPARDETGGLCTLEFVAASGEKRFLPNGRKSGAFGWIGPDPIDVIAIGEGYATCASIAQATGYPCAVAFDAGGLMSIAKAIRGKWPHVRIVLCADDDTATPGNPGVTKATAAANAVGGILAVPEFGLSRPSGATDFNDMALHCGIDAVAALMRKRCSVAGRENAGKPIASSTGKKAAKPPKTTRAQDGRSHFKVDDSGVWFHGFNSQGEALPPHWICTPLHVTAKTRDGTNNDWGYLLEFEDPDGKAKRWAVPGRLFAGDGTELRSTLLSMGLKIGVTQVARLQISNYIQTAQTDERARCAARVGWHDRVFVLPDRTIGTSSERVIFQAESAVESQFRQCGTLDDWKREVASLCVDNSRLAFCVSAAFAGPLLHFAGQQSGGFHLMGNSTAGKTTALRVAASVFGGRDYMRSWRATDNALEMTAAQHCDTLLILDEIGQVDPKVVGDVIYMIANEAGKGRATRSAVAKPVLTWRLLFLSSGEKSLSAIMAEANKTAKAGQDVRLATIPADAGLGFGTLEVLHGFESPKALADHIALKAGEYYGTAGPAFIEWVADQIDDLPGVLRDGLRSSIDEMVPEGSHAQVSRVAQRFAVVGLAGEMATAAGVTGWPVGAAQSAAARCFSAWLRMRGTAGDGEDIAMLQQARGFLEAHGDARFTWVHRNHDDHRPATMHRAGFKRHIQEGRPVSTNAEYYAEYGEKMDQAKAHDAEIEFLIMPDVFKNEVCKGFDHKAMARLLVQTGCLIADNSGRFDRQTRIPGVSGRMRLYHVTARIFEIDVV